MVNKRIEIEVEYMKAEHLPEVLEIERESFYAPWSKKAFLNEINQNKLSIMLVARAKDQEVFSGILGYACIWSVIDEFHITNVAVMPEFRGKGIGEQLIGFIVTLAKEKGVNILTLEVRQSNYGAIRLYCKTGFMPVRIRKRYYSDTDEDAMVMELHTRSRKV